VSKYTPLTVHNSRGVGGKGAEGVVVVDREGNPRNTRRTHCGAMAHRIAGVSFVAQV
jgi:hypothetical protein